MIDDAAAVASGRRTDAAPAEVIERAPLDAKELGGLVDGEKGLVVIVEHERILQGFDVANLRDVRSAGEVQFAQSSNCTPHQRSRPR